MITPTTEDYVKAIWLLRESLGVSPVPMGELAKKLGVSPGTVTTMVKSIAKDGLAHYQPRQGAALTEEGEALALRMVRRHRLVELFLVEKLKMDWSEVHEEAERLEHAISETVVERLAEFLGNPSADPHGDPIPRRNGSIPGNAGTSPLSEALPGYHVEVSRLKEQGPEILEYFSQHGLRPGSRFEVVSKNAAGKVVELRDKGGELIALSLEIAEAIEVITKN